MARSRAASAAHSGPGPRSGPAADSPPADPAAPERTPDPAPGTGSAAAPPPAGAGLAPAGLSGRLLGLLHLLTSFALSALYLVPAFLVAVPAVGTLFAVIGAITDTPRPVGSLVGLPALPGLPERPDPPGLPEPPGRSGPAGWDAGDPAGPVASVVEALVGSSANGPSPVLLAALAVVLSAAATLLARLACHIQRRRLEDVFGIVESGPPRPAAALPWPLRALNHLYGRDAWTALMCCTLTGVQGVVFGGIALGLVVYGIGMTLGSLMGLGYAMASETLDVAGSPLVWIALGPLGVSLGVWLVPLLVRLEVEVSRRLLLDAPENLIRRRLAEVQDSRSRMVDAAEAERRRIERDLHDGAQQRLLAVTMTLSRARARFDRGAEPEQIRALIDEARAEAKEVMAELRDVARGLHPRVLTDHGLEAALPVAAGRCPVPVQVRVDLPERPSARAEGVAYYVASEALTNVAKHAGARGVVVRAERVRRRGGAVLRLSVADDGAGGADPDSGSGLYGLWDRVNAVDGTLAVHSPPGEGTVLTAEIPWKA
ncbi:sensor histidine kinase [Streptomonospora nanhaiensis]|uniref:histidine kinase n=1 Tax=Streptomonospora nanhaiensis TaxID=1323731 RepID=A0A853BM21_9ACTN|nr:histidine kinase [Streptomonospora nanhaiensis]NYI96273.1 signal transduction histidine kinase [Streptomonospora nanhaiensis]